MLKMLNEYLISLNENKIMNHSIKLNGMVELTKLNMLESINPEPELLFS